MTSGDMEELTEISGGLVTKHINKYSSQRDDRDKLKCSHCGGSRHTRDECYRIIGYSEWWSDPLKRREPRQVSDKGKASVVVNETKKLEEEPSEISEEETKMADENFSCAAINTKQRRRRLFKGILKRNEKAHIPI